MGKKPSNYTKAELEDVIALIHESLKARINLTFKLLDQSSKLVPFIFNPAQEHYWPRITERDLILKSRKLGFSMLRLARMLAKCANIKHRRCVIISHEAEATQRMLARAGDMVKRSSPKIITEGDPKKNTIVFPETESTIYIGTAGSKAFGRGDDITDYHLTEFAFWPKPDMITGVEEACLRGDSEGCIETTAHGYGTPYHKLWERSQDNKKGVTMSDGKRVGYTPHFYSYKWDPTCRIEDHGLSLNELGEYEYRLVKELGFELAHVAWRRMKKKQMFDPSKFPQEYPATPEEAFLHSGNMAYDTLALQAHDDSRRPILWEGEIVEKNSSPNLDPRQEGRLKIYLMPRSKAVYLISGDVASGDQGDKAANSVWDIYDISTGEQVAQWAGKIQPDDFAEVGILLGALYNWAMLAPEVNNHGRTTCTTIQKSDYPNLYYRNEQKDGTRMGWHTSGGKTGKGEASGTRAELLDASRQAVKDYKTKINNTDTLSEMRTLETQEGGGLDAAEGCQKDRVITNGIAMALIAKMSAGEISAERFELGGRRDNDKSLITIPRGKRGYR